MSALKKKNWKQTANAYFWITVGSILYGFVFDWFFTPNLLGYGGIVAMIGCSAILIGLGFTLFGIWGALCMALLVLPTAATAAIALDREYPFWVGVAAGCTAMFVSMSLAVMILSALAGSDVVTAISAMVREMFEESGALGDMMLSLMVQLGVANVPADALDAQGMLMLTPELRENMVNALVTAVDAALRLELPMQMATGSVAAGLLGQAVLCKGMLSRGVKVDYPPLRTWRVPNGWGRVLGGTLAALYVLVMLVPGRLDSMFYVFSGVFDQVFAIQGVASVCYMMHKRGKGRLAQALVFALGYVIIRPAAVMIGVLDQAMDISRRRAELEELEKKNNPFDPRAQV